MPRKRPMPSKDRAERAARSAIAKGALTRPSACAACGAVDKKIHAHHPDYNKPLDVMWLCTTCHSNWHRDHAAIELGQSTAPLYHSDLGFTPYFQRVLEAGVCIKGAAELLGVSRPAIYRWARLENPEKWVLILFQYLIDETGYTNARARLR